MFLAVPLIPRVVLLRAALRTGQGLKRKQRSGRQGAEGCWSEKPGDPAKGAGRQKSKRPRHTTLQKTLKAKSCSGKLA